jgi:aminoglycoside/choline kinase family phosphotransferase
MTTIEPASAALRQWTAVQLQLAPADLVLEPASADASFRRYFRAASGVCTWIVMDASAERASCGPFVRIAELLAGGGLHAPAILAADLERGWLLLSDLGRRTYLEAITGEPEAVAGDRVDALFDAAIDALIALQRIEAPADLPVYDAALLRRELELFPEWYLQRHLGIAIDGALRRRLDTLFEQLIERALAQPRVLVHRDFMPRNLMLSEPNPGVLDFQDAVRGPISYDPICLFKDAFLSWPEQRAADWLQRYWRRGRAAGLPLPASWEAFYADCDFMGAQRHLKVIGIFARIHHRDGKPKYLADAPRFFAYLRGASQRRPELADLAALLDSLPAAVAP